MKLTLHLLFVASITCIATSAPVPLIREAAIAPLGSSISLADNVHLAYTIDVAMNEATFNLSAQDSTVFGSTSERAWMSFGFTEPSTSGFLGADLVTVEFLPHTTTECRVRDGFMPFAAYPLDYALPGAYRSLVREDKCQNDSSWEVLFCKRDVVAKQVTLSFRRPLTAHDNQDRPLGPGTQHAVYSYGNGAESADFASGKHGGKHIRLYEGDGSIAATPVATRNLPRDVWGNSTIVASHYTIDSQHTSSYACTSLEAAVPAGGSASLVAFEAVLNAKKGRLAVGSMVLYACPKFAGFKYLLGTQGCGSLPGQFPSPSSFCTDVLFTWANGVDRFVLPDDVSFVIDDSNKYLVLETMYHNPKLAQGLIDESGMVLHYSRDVRQHAAGTLLLGDAIGALKSRAVNSAELSSTCSSACTQNFVQDLHIFASSPRMHRTGRSLATHKYDGRGVFIETVSRVDHWSAAHQATQMLERQVTLAPGEQLGTTCRYDTRKRPSTRFGFDMDDEVCMEYAFYYPRQKQQLGRVKGLPVLSAGGSLTYCGVSSAGSPNGTLCGYKVMPDENIPLSTAEVPSDTFGSAPAMCTTRLPRAEPKIEPRKPFAPFACFPSHARVRVDGDRIARMDELRVGDVVEVGNGIYSPVIGFTHREASGEYDFVAIQLGRRTLQASPGHLLLHASGRLVEASQMRIGDIMVDRLGHNAVVSAVYHTRAIGLYNPQTLHGNIVVNDIVATTYTSAVKSSAAHASLIVLRSITRVFGTNTEAGLILEKGAQAVRAMVAAFGGLVDL